MPVTAFTSSFGAATSSSLTSAKTCALFPDSAMPSNTGNVTGWRSPPPLGTSPPGYIPTAWPVPTASACVRFARQRI